MIIFFQVMQRRMDGSENFFRNWTDYKNGFGDPCKEFWIGLDVLHRITTTNKYKLLITLEDFDGDVRCAAYDSFTVDSPETNYTLRIGIYTGSAGWTHEGMPFSTFDSDHDPMNYNCAKEHSGAWWYNACHQCNLNGLYLRGDQKSLADGVNWNSFRGYTYSLKFVEMRVQLA
ncbi:hypothetical protein HELRODRAFT_80673 [Helobdella robusta]|uniref:Fibrinogen C-terminal domain-containing protein n=1 Tax=Helobdella robusta TaxID=6412 RepID=T1G438_HELRO|nr:hypothetical protein HELRODRAFT_80673 [Helobdella robusta]ESO03151.1 hypothetical protein HELRODRAFT_80673 [Helobdella robusta]